MNKTHEQIRDAIWRCFRRLVRCYYLWNARINVIIGWPIIWAMDVMIAWCDYVPFKESRADSRKRLKAIWNRYSSPPNTEDRHEAKQPQPTKENQ